MTDSPEVPERLTQALMDRYEPVRELGQGGMATVYLADDLKHNRKVALKVLRPELAAVVGAERFLTEIETTANLQHPNILPLFDSGTADGFVYFVMPYIEGESLRERLDREKQLPVEESVRIAVEVAEALHAAHEQGVVHRDIKPANIMMSRGRPLVADFGIALAVSEAGGGRLTETGLSLGTPYYMSPEQASADRDPSPASDVYSLGCVLYEMLVGEPPHTGATAQAVLTKILTDKPKGATEARPSVPTHVDAALRKALEKLPADRFQSADELARALADPGFRYGQAAGGPREVAASAWKPAAIGLGALALLLGVALSWTLARPKAELAVQRFRLAESALAGTATFDLIPDGSGIVFQGTGPEGTQLWIRRWSELNAITVPGGATGLTPSVSPDGQEVAFTSSGSLRVVPLTGGIPRTVATDARCCPRWAPDGSLYYQTGTLEIASVPAQGGESRPVTELGPEDGAHGDFQVLPGGRTGVFTVWTRLGALDQHRIRAMSLETGESVDVTPGMRPFWLGSGRLAFVSGNGVLMAALFDEGTMSLTGGAVPVTEGVLVGADDYPRYAISGSGSLAYAAGESGAEQLVWVTRSGSTDPLPGAERANYRFLSLSPTGESVAFSKYAEGAAQSDVWVLPMSSGGAPLRLTFEDDNDHPTWSADGSQVLFDRGGAGGQDLLSIAADRSADPGLLHSRDSQLNLPRAAPGGRTLVFYENNRERGDRDILVLEVGATEARPFLTTPANERSMTLSRDGRWLAYVSDEAGSDEVFVTSFPDGSGKWQVSNGGGWDPIWAHNGRELFYRGRSSYMAAEYSVEPVFSVTSRTEMFPTGAFEISANAPRWDVAPDDSRFLMIQPMIGSAEFILVQNWIEDAKARMER